MLKEDPNKIYKLLEDAYEKYTGDVSELLRHLLYKFGYRYDLHEKDFSNGEYFNKEHSKRVMPKQFWNILFKNIECFNQKECFELLISIFESCICPKELFYAVYNIVPNISDYLKYNEGTYHNGIYWNQNTKYVRLLAHAERNKAIRMMLLTMLTNPDCPQDIKDEIASSQDKAKYYMVTDIARSNISVASPMAPEVKHTLPFTYESNNWWNPACSEKIVGDLFFMEIKFCSRLTDDENNMIFKINKDTKEDVLRTLANSNSTYIRGKVARHKNCPEDVLITLSTDEQFYVRYNCFCNIKTPKEAFEQNIEKNFTMIDCVMMLCHPNCPEEVVDKILMSNFSYIGYLSDECPNLPEDAIESKLFDCNDNKYINLFCRKNCTINLIKKLINKYRCVRENAAFLASLTVFYDICISKHAEPQYKSSYDSELESQAFINNCRGKIAFNSKMGIEPSLHVIKSSPICAPESYIEDTNHSRLEYDVQDLVSNRPSCLTLEKK